MSRRLALSRSKRIWLLAGGAVAFLIVGTVVALDRRPQPTSVESVEVVTTSTLSPEEQRPGVEIPYTWSGNAEDPKYLRLPTIGAEGYIQAVGKDAQGRIAVPTNIHFGGWFVEAALPGNAGLAIISGHTNGPTRREAIFTHLGELGVGDTFSLETGDGSILGYVVRSVAVYPLEAAANALFSQSPRIESQLTLITCTGPYNEQTKDFEERTIVVSELVSRS